MAQTVVLLVLTVYQWQIKYGGMIYCSGNIGFDPELKTVVQGSITDRTVSRIIPHHFLCNCWVFLHQHPCLNCKIRSDGSIAENECHFEVATIPSERNNS
jgi:hypothetical protein